MPRARGRHGWCRRSRLLITLRASTLRAHAGQWALPGGRLDPGETVREAAVRGAG
ncbi:NUDIX domain-containing protein [Aeromicrobium sp. UC242_57]|uniref:NUDIX domain-containing protein n=1 Tax=Aeromicrobium sp. UC242_57 TaxID=3374624 RepID=UPI00379C5FBD